MEGRGRGGGGRGRGGNRGGGERGGSSGHQGGHQQRRDQTRGPQFPGSAGGRDGGSRGRSDRGGGQGSGQHEGDWSCSACGFNNFARNQKCYRCQIDRSGAGGSGTSERGGHRGGSYRGGGDQRGGGRGRGNRGHGEQSGGNWGRGGRGDEIDWAAQEEMETASQTSTQSDPAAAELADRVERMALNDLPSDLAGEDKDKFSVIPHRINQGPTVGTRGRNITIEVNHLKLSINSGKKVAIHYDCAFDPDKLSRKVLREVMSIVRERCFPTRHAGFDGKKNLYSCGDTPLFKGAELNESVELPREEGKSKSLKVEVTIKEVQGKSRIDLSQIADFVRHKTTVYPDKAVQIMEIVLRNTPASSGFTQVGRSFFTAPRSPVTLGNGLELYHGFFQSVVLGWETYLNVDVAHKGFPEGRQVSDVMCEFKTGKRKPHPSDLWFRPNEFEDTKKFLKGLRVAYAIPKVPKSRRKYTVIGVKRPANQQTFIFKQNENDQGRKITIEEYFSREKGYKLKFPNLPCLHVGNPKKDTCLPPELCTVIVGQVVMKKLDPEQTRNMIRETAKPPAERKQKIMDMKENIKYAQNECVKEFGISVGQQFTRVPARILDPPTIYYGNGTVEPANGEWQAKPFKQATALKKWVIASVGYCESSHMRKLTEVLKQVSKDVGMTVDEPFRTDILLQDARKVTDHVLEQSLLKAFKEYKDNGVQMVVVIISKESYGKVKKVAEIDVGLLTQCILEKTVTDKMTAATGKNMLLKINTKLNGVNHTVVRSQQQRGKSSDRVMELLRGTMLMGADVTHPSPDQKEIPSVAAVTASHDPLQFKYNMMWKLQSPKQEIIGDLHKVVIKQLRYYKEKNQGRAPDRIIFYRDGVSEGQFIQVLQVEMTCIKWACRKELGRDIPVTFLVVQKRHHTRFFPTDRSHTDRKGNVPPGTVVDTNITHPTEADFYMVSHASLQGTSRPTKYHKLWDDNKINEDDLEELTFFLCHMFSRCTRSVSYPAPTYYAHLGAARGKAYLEGANINVRELGLEMERRIVHPSIVNGAPMFFT